MQKRLALLLALIGAVLFGAASAHAAPILSTPDGKALLLGAMNQPPTVAIDFTKGSYAEKGAAFGSFSALLGSHFSGSAGYAQTSAGALQYFPTRNNGVANSANLTNAVVGTLGSGGALPSANGNQWSMSGALASGLNFAITGAGTEYGMTYVELSWTGTPAANGATGVYFDSTANAAAAASGQTWETSVYVRAPTASSGIYAQAIGVYGRASTGSGTETSTTPITPTAALQRFAANPLTLANASTARVTGGFGFSYTAGTPVNAVFRIYEPMTEQELTPGPPGGYPSAFIATTTGPVSVNDPRITDLGLLVEQSSTNLALQSQNLASATWTQDNTTASTSGNAPDGTATAQVLNEGTATGAHFAYQTITVTSGQQASVSEYVNTCTTTRRYVQVGMSSSTPAGGVWATFDTQGLTLTEATASGAGVYTSSTKAQLGSGCWWRIAVTGSITGATTYYIAPELASTATPGGFGFTGQSYTGASLVGVFWGIQAETLGVATSYIPTTTASATRAADVATITGLPGSAKVTLFTKILPMASGSGTNAYLAALTNGTTSNRIALFRPSGGLGLSTRWSVGGSTYEATGPAGNVLTLGSSAKVAISGPSNINIAANGGLTTSGASAPANTSMTTLNLGINETASIQQLNDYLQAVTVYPYQMTPAQLQALTH